METTANIKELHGMSNFHTLNVTKTIPHPKANAKTVCFSIVKDKMAQYIWQDYNGVKLYVDFPPELKWKAGQYLPVHIEIGEDIFSGNYPITVAPESTQPLQVMVVKNLEDPVSEYLADYIHLGDEIKISAPTGDFHIEPDSERERTYYFFASHTGILSIFAMIQSILIVEPHSRVCLLYVNDSEDKILLRKALYQLTLQAAENFSLRYFLKSPNVLSDFSCWKSGAIDASTIEQLLVEHPPSHQYAHYYIATDARFCDVIMGALLVRGVSPEFIHVNNLEMS